MFIFQETNLISGDVLLIFLYLTRIKTSAQDRLTLFITHAIFRLDSPCPRTDRAVICFILNPVLVMCEITLMEFLNATAIRMLLHPRRQTAINNTRLTSLYSCYLHIF